MDVAARDAAVAGDGGRPDLLPPHAALLKELLVDGAVQEDARAARALLRLEDPNASMARAALATQQRLVLGELRRQHERLGHEVKVRRAVPPAHGLEAQPQVGLDRERARARQLVDPLVRRQPRE